MDRNNSIFTEIFCGQLCSTIQCRQCHYVSKAFDPFWDLSLPIPTKSSSKSSSLYGGFDSSTMTSNPTLLDCFHEFTRKDVLEGNDQFYCSKCKQHQDGTKEFNIYRFPRVLVVHLKRFSYRKYSRSKLNTEVVFPPRLNLTEFMPRRSSQQEPPIYNLYAVSNHMGSTGGGHYTAHCNISPSRGADSWFTFNDSNVRQTSAAGIGGPSAYVLFYTQERTWGDICGSSRWQRSSDTWVAVQPKKKPQATFWVSLF